MIPSQVCIINCCGIWLKTAAWVGADDDITENTSSSYSTNTSCYSSCCIEERAKELASVILGNDQDENNRNTSSDNSNSSNRSNTSSSSMVATVQPDKTMECSISNGRFEVLYTDDCLMRSRTKPSNSGLFPVFDKKDLYPASGTRVSLIGFKSKTYVGLLEVERWNECS